MNSSLELQKQIKDNAEEVRRFVCDLGSWEEEMKRKESEARAGTSKETSVPPVRNSSNKRDSCDTGESQVKKRISSSDYTAWEKFDVEKACMEVDDPTSTETEEEKKIRERRQRDEANVEKEKGNQFVKKEKWDSAIECYSKAIKCYPRDAIFYCNRALCFLKKKDYRAAETDCTSAISLDNTYVKAFHRRGLARKELNQLDEAAADLQKACEIEPNNTAIARDYNTVRLKLGQLNLNTIVVTETIEAEAEIFNPLKSDPILPAKKHRPSTSTCKESIDERKPSSSSVVWPKLDDCSVIEPVFLPPHKRSKRPLQRIQIEEVGETSLPKTTKAAAVPKLSVTVDQAAQEQESSGLGKAEEQPKISNEIKNQSKTQTSKSDLTLNQSSTASASKLDTSLYSVPKVVPAVPKNSVQFLAGWRQINKDHKMCFQYLKKINGEDLPKIFQDSLDGNILSQILRILACEFAPANEPVLSYLQGLAKVPRFRTLTLFLSKSDKEYVQTLFKHTESLEKTPTNVIASLKTDYEV